MEAVPDTHICCLCRHSRGEGCSGAWPYEASQAPVCGLSASLKPGCVGGCSPGARPEASSQCIMDEGLPVPCLGGGCG